MIRSFSAISGPRLSFVIALLASVSFIARADAYTLVGKSWPTDSNIVMQMNLGQAGRTLIDGNTSWNAAAAPALDAWNQKMAGVQFSKVMDSTAPVASGDRVNSIAFSSTVFGQAFGTGTLAVTYYFTQGSNFLEADVLFNTAQTFDSYRGPLRFTAPGGYATGDIRRTLLHELGHALGMNHYSGDNIMAPITSDRETLSSDDIAGIQSLYGVPAPGPTPTPTPGPSPVGVMNDFNSDSNPDLVWQNNVTGQRALWFMAGSTISGTFLLPTVSLDWEIASTADFDSDGKTDLLWQNKVTGQVSIWLMNGTTMVGGRVLPSVSVLWKIAATGDFNNDGQTDIVWQNTATGQRAIWLMNGTTVIGDRVLPTISTTWQIAATDDFNGDGQVDLVWQNTVTGQRAIWFMNGSTMTGSCLLPAVSTLWLIAGTGDYNGDGQMDIVWQNTVTGQRVIWLMNGSTRTGALTLPNATTVWEIRNH